MKKTRENPEQLDLFQRKTFLQVRCTLNRIKGHNSFLAFIFTNIFGSRLRKVLSGHPGKVDFPAEQVTSHPHLGKGPAGKLSVDLIIKEENKKSMQLPWASKT